MIKFALPLIVLFLVSCGGKSSPLPPSVLIQTKVVKQSVPDNLLQEYGLPKEPETRDVRGIKSYVFELEALNQRHNQDKKDIKKFQSQE